MYAVPKRIWEWIIRPETGFGWSLREDAPDDIRQEFEEMMEYRRKLKAQGICR